MSWAELEKLPECQHLTKKQKLFVAEYCESGLVTGNYDPVAATQTAYECKTPEVARIMSYALMSSVKIIAVLNRHFGTEPIEQFMVTLDRAITNKKLTMAQILALRLKAEIQGFTSRLPDRQPINAGFIEAQETTKKVRKVKNKAAGRASKVTPEAYPEF